tara:strand:+ start:5913 stop:6929 length:1017 start_codon:yes stop_codon:yes gene_type:complete
MIDEIKGLSLAAAFSLIGAVGAQAQDLTLTLAHGDPAEWTTSKKGAAAQVFKQLVEAETGGRITVELYDSNALGNETDMLQSVQEEALSMTIVSGAFSLVCPEAAVLDIPYLFESSPEAWEVLDGEFGAELSASCIETANLRTLAYGENGFRNFTNSVRPITSPADMAGMKIRVQDAPVYNQMITALGATPTPIPWTELATSLATGVVDGQENPVMVIWINNLYEMQPYMTLDQHLYGTDFIVINEDIFQGLSAEDQTILTNAATIAGTVGRAIQNVHTADGLSELAAAGQEIYKPTPDDIAAFREAAQGPVRDWLATQIDPVWIERLDGALADARSE